MFGTVLDMVLGGAAGLVAGALAAWIARSAKADREMETANDNWRRKLEQASSKVRVLSDQASSLKVNLAETQQIAVKSRHSAMTTGTELESLRDRLTALARDLSAARAERDEYSNKASQGQQYVLTAKQKLEQQAAEFEKSRDFYKNQIAQAVDARQSLERKVERLQSEQDSLNTLLASAKAEHDSINKMLASANSRLRNLDAAEQKTIELEADKAELRHELESVKRDADKLRRKIGELEDIKSQNRELTRCLESMENSRKQYESDARRYRDQFEKSEQESETLRMKLGDIESSLSDMQEAHEEARNVTRLPKPDDAAPANGEGDDLTEIVGIGKVFEAMLHKLGIYYFRQIATFGPSELARVNEELKEFKGRIEHDDWIGQARELHYKKYGMAGSMKQAK